MICTTAATGSANTGRETHKRNNTTHTTHTTNKVSPDITRFLMSFKGSISVDTWSWSSPYPLSSKRSRANPFAAASLLDFKDSISNPHSFVADSWTLPSLSR